MFKKLTCESNGYSSSSSVEYRFRKLRLSLEDGGSVSNSSVFTQSNSVSLDNEEDIFPTVEGDTDSRIDTYGDETGSTKKDKDAKSNDVKENYKAFIDNPNVVNGVKTAAALASKAADFTKSSFAKINAIPENRRQAASAKLISQAADAPSSLGIQLKNFAMKAGKGAGFAALSVACLPAAAAALVSNNLIKKTDKKRAAEDLKREIQRLDVKLDSLSGDEPDLKADLLIAKRQAEEALNKIKYGLDMRGV